MEHARELVGHVRNYGGQYVLHSAKNKNSIFQGDFAKKKCKTKKSENKLFFFSAKNFKLESEKKKNHENLKYF